MARSRNIKPGFFINEVLGELPPLARILFAGLWCHADREGRLEDRLKRLKPQILPYDECDIDALAQGLHDARLVHRYVIDGKGYIQVIEFNKHQNPHVKEQASTIPAPDMHGACTGVARLIPSLLIPDSLNPHTDSLTPSTPSLEKSSTPKKKNGFELPVWVPEVQWHAWLEARAKVKKPATDWAKKLAIAKLEGLREEGHHPAAVLAQSAFHNWPGLYPIKQEQR